MAKPKRRVHIPPLAADEAYDLMKRMNRKIYPPPAARRRTKCPHFPLLSPGAAMHNVIMSRRAPLLVKNAVRDSYGCGEGSRLGDDGENSAKGRV